LEKAALVAVRMRSAAAPSWAGKSFERTVEMNVAGVNKSKGAHARLLITLAAAKAFVRRRPSRQMFFGKDLIRLSRGLAG
jgi:hypothetical protein